jgi:hypothetical protein
VGLQRVGRDHDAGQLQLAQQRLQPGHLAGGAVDLALGEHGAGGAVDRGQQMDPPNDAALLRLAGRLLIEQDDEWLVARRYLSQESLTLVLDPEPAPATKEVTQLIRA